MGADNELNLKKTLLKGGRVFLYGMAISAGVAVEAILTSQTQEVNLDLKKVAIAVSLSGVAGGFEAVRNWRKAQKGGRRRARKGG